MRSFENQWNLVSRKVLREDEDPEMVELMKKSARKIFELKTRNAPTSMVVQEMKKRMDISTRFLTKKYPKDKIKIEKYNRYSKKNIEMEMRLKELDKILRYRNLTSKEEKELIKIRNWFRDVKIPVW